DSRTCSRYTGVAGSTRSATNSSRRPRSSSDRGEIAKSMGARAGTAAVRHPTGPSPRRARDLRRGGDPVRDGANRDLSARLDREAVVVGGGLDALALPGGGRVAAK